MPTKFNHAGNQQPYVPAGNGDASGEYAEHETGGNVHYRAGVSSGTTGIQIKQKPKDDTTSPKTAPKGKNHAENLYNYIKDNSRLDESQLATLQNEIATGTSDAQRILNSALNKHKYTYEFGKGSYYMPSSDNLVLANADLKSNRRSQGEVFWHENGHLIDWSNADFDYQDYLMGHSREAKTLSVSYRSTKDNKTMFEALVEESKNFKKNIEDVKNEVRNYEIGLKNKYLAEAGIDPNEINELRKKKSEIVDETYKDPRYVEALNKQNKLSDEYINSFGSEKYEEIRAQFRQAVDETSALYDKISEEKGIKILNEKFNKLTDISYEAGRRANDEVTKKYSSLSDMYSAITKGRDDLSCGSHSARYWKQSQYHQPHEFFAEVFSAYATNDKEGMDIIKKYFPRSAEIVEEIIKEYK